MTATLEAYGWTRSWQAEFARQGAGGSLPARVVLAQRGLFRVQGDGTAFDAVLAGRFRHLADDAEDLPVVGDWVVCHRPDAAGAGLIDAVLPRQSKLSRKVAGSRAVEQVLAANVDKILIVMGLDGDFNLRRLERYLVMARESGGEALVVLSKSDLSSDLPDKRGGAEQVAAAVPVLVVSALAGELEELRVALAPGETVALIGSSGAGKSTLINALAGQELLRTGAVRASDERGQHTTTHRELVLLPDGCLLIDNPGLRELQLWSAEDGLEDSFDDLQALARDCRFRDCSHDQEPGCAVREAIATGTLEPDRLANFNQLQKEAQSLAARRDARAYKAAEKKLGKLYKRVQQEMRRRKGE